MKNAIVTGGGGGLGKSICTELSKNGYAVAYRKYSKKYISNEIYAKKNKLGVWQGEFDMPWDYRRKK